MGGSPIAGWLIFMENPKKLMILGNRPCMVFLLADKGLKADKAPERADGSRGTKQSCAPKKISWVQQSQTK